MKFLKITPNEVITVKPGKGVVLGPDFQVVKIGDFALWISGLITIDNATEAHQTVLDLTNLSVEPSRKTYFAGIWTDNTVTDNPFGFYVSDTDKTIKTGSDWPIKGTPATTKILMQGFIYVEL